jgi:hypothetical protein
MLVEDTTLLVCEKKRKRKYSAKANTYRSIERRGKEEVEDDFVYSQVPLCIRELQCPRLTLSKYNHLFHRIRCLCSAIKVEVRAHPSMWTLSKPIVSRGGKDKEHASSATYHYFSIDLRDKRHHE